MAHLTVWTKTIFFYAIGNTPAVCLTSELPPEQSADILLLGCGDVRNIMYTVYADLGGRKWHSLHVMISQVNLLFSIETYRLHVLRYRSGHIGSVIFTRRSC